MCVVVLCNLGYELCRTHEPLPNEITHRCRNRCHPLVPSRCLQTDAWPYTHVAEIVQTMHITHVRSSSARCTDPHSSTHTALEGATFLRISYFRQIQVLQYVWFFFIVEAQKQCANLDLFSCMSNQLHTLVGQSVCSRWVCQGGALR